MQHPRELHELIACRARPSITIYMPMEAYGRDARRNPILFKNLLRQVRSLLSDADADAVLRPLSRILEGPSFWRECIPGIAVFHNPRQTEVYRLPKAPEPLAVVGDRYHVKPLIAMLGETDLFYVLALSEGATRLLEVAADEIRPLAMPRGVPESLADVQPSAAKEKELQAHSAGRGTTIYHGNGGEEQRRQEDLRRYLSAVDRGLRRTLPDPNAPLVLAGVSELTSMFRSVSTHDNLAEQTIEGNVKDISAAELRDRAHELALPRLRAVRRRALRRASELVHTPQVVCSVESVVPAAMEGRVDTLIVEQGRRCWGHFDPDRRSTQFEPRQTYDNEDLLDLAAVLTIENGGKVFLAKSSELPDPEALVAAVLRY